MNYAPIVLFVYNRPRHTQQTVEALQKNNLAKQSELFIYRDAAKNDDAKTEVEAVRRYLKTIDGFKSIAIIERDKNLGLADSIIDGVTKVVNEHGKVIVLEDDLVTSPYFLTFMNDALEKYKDDGRVWHISGWNYPIGAQGLAEVFFWRVMNCWGWATWKNEWSHFDKNAEKLIENFTKDDIDEFNLGGVNNAWNQVLQNKKGEIDTWAVFWYAAIFKHDGLCLNPTRSYVQYIGNDGSGVNCGKSSCFLTQLSNIEHVTFSERVEVSEKATKKIKDFYISLRPSLIKRGTARLKSILFKGHE